MWKHHDMWKLLFPTCEVKWLYGESQKWEFELLRNIFETEQKVLITVANGVLLLARLSYNQTLPGIPHSKQPSCTPHHRTTPNTSAQHYHVQPLLCTLKSTHTCYPPCWTQLQTSLFVRSRCVQLSLLSLRERWSCTERWQGPGVELVHVVNIRSRRGWKLTVVSPLQQAMLVSQASLVGRRPTTVQ